MIPAVRSVALLGIVVLCASAHASAGADSGTPASAASPSAASPPQANYAIRLKNAETVRVTTSVLEIAPGSTLNFAHEKLDPLADPAHPPQEEEEEIQDKNHPGGERKVLWRLAATDYSSLYVQTDDNGKITSVTAVFRPGKNPPFTQLGEVGKAPVHTAHQIAWDVIRPDQPLTRVIAQGADEKAERVTIFFVRKRPDSQENPAPH